MTSKTDSIPTAPAEAHGSASGFYPADIERLRELTDANEHELALWYAAHQLGLDQLEHEAATHTCRYMLAGELTPDLHLCSRHLRAKLQTAMDAKTLAAFRSAT